MANTIKIKRSAVPGKVPTVGDLQLSELAVNTYDGKLFLKKDNGAESIVEIGGSGGGSTGPILETAQVITSNITLSSGSHGLSVGPVEVASGYTVTIPANAVWAIV